MVEGRFLSMRAHARELGVPPPSRILATGGGSKNLEVCVRGVLSRFFWSLLLFWFILSLVYVECS